MESTNPEQLIRSAASIIRLVEDALDGLTLSVADKGVMNDVQNALALLDRTLTDYRTA
ncbi:MAG: hypothetical protein QM689_09250 [Oscillospiraceae bacterium]